MDTELEDYIRISLRQLSNIRSRLTQAVFPLSNLPNNKHHQQIAHAITAISLAQQILLDVDQGKEGE